MNSFSCSFGIISPLFRGERLIAMTRGITKTKIAIAHIATERRRRKESATASVSVIERDVKGNARERGSESESETEIATGGDATGPGHEIAADIAADKLGCIYHKHLLLSILCNS